MLKSILQSALIVNLALLLGRASGLIRELFVANIYGVSEKADIVILLLTLPDVLTGILVGGGLSAAFLPAFQKDCTRSMALFLQSATVLFIAFTLIACLLAWKSEHLISVLAPGLSTDAKAIATTHTRWIVILLPLSVLTGLTTALLHAQHKFFVAGMGTLLVNSTVIIGLCLAMMLDNNAIIIVVISIILAGALRLFSQLWAARVSLSYYRASFSEKLFTYTLFRRYGEAMMAGGLVILFPIMARAFMSYDHEGGIATFNYALRLVELPLLIAVSFLSVVLFPRLSAAYQQDNAQYQNLLILGVHLILGIAVCVSSVLYSGIFHYASAIYGFSLDPEAINNIGIILAILIIGLPCQGLTQYLATTYNAANNTRFPMIVNLIGAISLFVLLFFKPSPTATYIVSSLVGIYLLCSILLLSRLSRSTLIQLFHPYKTFWIGLALIASMTLLLLPNLTRLVQNSYFALAAMAVWGILMLSFCVMMHRDARRLIFNKLKPKHA